MQETVWDLISGMLIYLSLFTLIPALIHMAIQVAIYKYDNRRKKH